MQSLVEKLLRQARLENRLEIALEPLAIDSLFRRLAEEREAVLAVKKIRLRWQESGLTVEADGELLAQALGNLLDNAIDFTPAQGEIVMSAEQQQAGLALTISDSGSGIPDYALGRIFERFYSLPRENGHKSSGLGLAFVREVARLHQGDIQLSNRPQGGVRAVLILHRPFT
ncbi:Sensor protein CreC [Raoultella terrigena]|nr:Sensor protein CreC [Raoultella terrigena]